MMFDVIECFRSITSTSVDSDFDKFSDMVRMGEVFD